ncbi:hypothetical protein C8J56DRAFT_154029 [Mycena floridula]|nr:hypothetical protein C8J56DRAFT_154029 [Mycena floridula]
MFLATTIVFVGDLINILIRISSLGGSLYPIVISQNYIIAGIIATHVLFFISDVLVVWRAWVICDRRLVKIILSCCIAGSLAGIIFEGLREVQVATGTKQLEITTMALSMLLPILITNSVATLTIGYKAWIYRCTFKKNPEVGRVYQVFLLFLKSGLLYIVIWALYFTLSLSFTSSASIGMGYLNIIVGYLLVLYPVLIIILIIQRPPLSDNRVSLWSSDMDPSQQSIILDIGPHKA